MIKMGPNIKMIMLYWFIMAVVEGFIALLVIHNPFQDILVLVIVLVVVICQTFIFVMIYCNLPYFAIEIGEKAVRGPSQFGLGWRKVVIPYDEFSHIVNHFLLSAFGLYYIKSREGKTISVVGFTEDQYKQLHEIIGSKR